MSLKGLNLNREKLINSVKRYCTLNAESSQSVADTLLDKGGPRRRLNVEFDGKNFFIDFHFNKNGTTSIDISGGNHREIKASIAEFIVSDNNCVLSKADADQWFVVKSIEADELDLFIDYVSTSEFVKETVKSDPSTGQFQYIGPYNEKFTVTYYNTKKLLLQGKPLLLFAEAVACITELLDEEKIFGSFNEYYKVEIKKDVVEEIVKIHLPDAHDKLPSKLKKTVNQAVYNMQIDGDMFDYTFLVFPALRALEGHLKYVVKENGLELTDGRFNLFENPKSNSGKYILQASCRTTVGCAYKIGYIEKAYQHISDRRHKYFHWEEEHEGLDQTMVIENIGNARTIITDTISLINEYYTL